jgi:hypothetical protein
MAFDAGGRPTTKKQTPTGDSWGFLLPDSAYFCGYLGGFEDFYKFQSAPIF